ncbi:unnamed protein product [Urochloa decumbens]|uniref:Uncharacterized protein n=1 Tax=Urochloa decumbens TaxID=240449 RepID=A0ABC8X9L8_9POAL
MSMSMVASSDDPPVDLEKGEVKAAATKKEVNPRVAMCVMVFLNNENSNFNHRISIRWPGVEDAVAVVEVLIFIGLIAWRFNVSNDWWDPLLAFVVLLPILLLILWIKPKTNYAMAKAKLALASDHDSDLATKLVAE